MISNENLKFIIIGIVILGGLFWVLQQRSVPVEPNQNEAAELYLKALGLGKDAENYQYGFMETINGYRIDTVLTVKGAQKYAQYKLPFARQHIFFLDNKTILCMNLRDILACNNVKNNSELKNILTGVERSFFNRVAIEQSVSHNRRLIEKGVIQFLGEPVEKNVNGKMCKQITYKYDHTQLTISDINALNINPSSLPKFNGQWCIDGNGNVYEKILSYEVSGRTQQTRWNLIEANWNYAGTIVLPTNDTNSTAVQLFLRTLDFQAEMRDCYEKEGEVRDRCISSFAVARNFPSACELAGSRKDRCYISLALSKQDVQLCESIDNQVVREDCYLEVAGKARNPALCNSITNQSKMLFCQNVSSAPPTSSNSSIGDEDLLNLFE